MERKKGVLSGIFVIVSILLLTVSVYAISGGNSRDVNIDSSPVYNMVLPTTESTKFTIDPYGLTAINGTGKTLEEILNSPVGVVTSGAVKIENKEESVGILVKADFTLKAMTDKTISLAKTKEEAKNGQADLYLEILPVGVTSGWAVTPVTIWNDGTSEQVGNCVEFKLENKNEQNCVYEFVINGYANPASEIWADLLYEPSQEIVELCMKFTFEGDQVDESSEDESESSSTEESSSSEESDSSSESSGSENPSTEESTTIPKEPTDVDYKDGSFELYIKKSEVSNQKPTAIHMVYLGKSYNIADYALVRITEEGDEYKILVQYFAGAAAEGRCQLVVYSGTTVIYDQATIRIE